MSVEAAKIVVNVDTNSDKATSQLRQLEKSIDNLADVISKMGKKTGESEEKLTKFQKSINKMASVGKTLAMKLTLPILGVAGVITKLASDSEETNAKFNTAFKGMEAQAMKSAKILQESYAMSSIESEKLLGNTGDLLKGFGTSSEKALEMSMAVQKLSADLASYNNIPTARASEAITKALLGEVDSLVGVGVKLSAVAVQQELVRMGASKLTGQALLQAKAQATLTLVMQQSQDAMGDMARTSGSFANQFKRLKARASDVGVEFGKILLPVMTKLVSVISGLVTWFSGLSKGTKTVILIMAGLLAIIPPIIIGIALLVKSVMALNVAMALNPVGLVIAGFVALGAIVAVTAVAIVKNWDNIKSGILRVWENIKTTTARNFLYIKLGMFNLLKGVLSVFRKVMAPLIKIVDGIIWGINKLTGKNIPSLSSKFNQLGKSIDDNIGDLNKKLDGSKGVKATTNAITNFNKKLRDIANPLQYYQKALKMKPKPAPTRTSSSSAKNWDPSQKTDTLAGLGDVSSQLALVEKAYKDKEKIIRRYSKGRQLSEQQEAMLAQSRLTESAKAIFDNTNLSLSEKENLLKAQYEKEKKLARDNASQLLAIEKAKNNAEKMLDEKRMQERLATIEKTREFTQAGLDILSGLSQVSQNNAQNEINALKEKNEAELEAMKKSGATAEEIATRKEELDKEMSAREKKLAHDNAVMNKKFAIANIILNTAIGISKAFAQTGVLGFVSAGLIATAGAVQLAVAQSQPIPSAQFGGEFQVPLGNQADSGLLRVNQGEQVSVKPVRESNSGSNDKTTLVIDGKSFDGYFTDKLQQVLNSGKVQIFKTGVVRV